MTQEMGFLNPPTVCIIPAESTTPAWIVWDVLYPIVGCANKAAGNSIIMIHYSGHARSNDFDELVLINTIGTKEMRAGSLFLISAVSNLFPTTAKVDIVWIFDCCYAFLAT
jgi:hypothetical protein